MPRPAPFRLLAALALFALAAPAQAWTLGDEGRTFHAMPERIDWSRPGLQHQLDGRFGVVHFRDAHGQSQTQPLAQLRYTVSLVQQTDSGWRWAVSVGIDASNLPREPRRPHGLMP